MDRGDSEDFYGSLDIIRLLLYKNADTTIKDEEGKTFYDYIENKPQIKEIVKQLQSYKKKPIQEATNLIPDLVNIVAEYV